MYAKVRQDMIQGVLPKTVFESVAVVALLGHEFQAKTVASGIASSSLRRGSAVVLQNYLESRFTANTKLDFGGRLRARVVSAIAASTLTRTLFSDERTIHYAVVSPLLDGLWYGGIHVFRNRGEAGRYFRSKFRALADTVDIVASTLGLVRVSD